MHQIGGITELEIVKGKFLSFELPDNQWYRDEIYLYCVPRLNGDQKEIILSHVSPLEWPYIWEISLMAEYDKPGIVYSVTKLLKDLDLNIYKTEGVTPSENMDFSIWFFINVRYFVENFNLDWRDTETIKSTLSSQIEMKFLENNLDYLYIKDIYPNKFLLENYWKIAKEKNINEVKNLTTFFDDPVYFRLNNLKGNIPVLKIFESLNLSISESPLYCTLFTNLVQSNYFIINFFSKNQKVIYLDILHKHEVGAINKLSDLIFKHSSGKYNLIYNRATVKRDKSGSEDYDSACHWYALLDLQDNEKLCNEIFESIENCSVTVGKGSVKVIKYTKNMEKIIHSKFKAEPSIENTESKKFKYKIFGQVALFSITATLCVLLLFRVDFDMNIITSSTLFIVIAFLIQFFKEMPDLISAYNLLRSKNKKND